MAIMGCGGSHSATVCPEKPSVEESTDSGDHSTAVVLPSPIRPTVLATGRQDLTREGNLTRIGAASPTPTFTPTGEVHPLPQISQRPRTPFLLSHIHSTQSLATESQVEFFKMLDRKIEEGPDYVECKNTRNQGKRNSRQKAIKLTHRQ